MTEEAKTGVEALGDLSINPPPSKAALKKAAKEAEKAARKAEVAARLVRALMTGCVRWMFIWPLWLQIRRLKRRRERVALMCPRGAMERFQ